YPPIASPGERVRVAVTVTNVGFAPASNVSVAFFDADPAGPIQIGPTQAIAALAPNEAAAVFVEWDTTGHAGTHRILALVDPQNAIEEASEDNNAAAQEVTIAQSDAPTVGVALDAKVYLAADVVHV